MQSQSVENVFARSWHLLASNWIIIIPGLVIGLIVGILEWLAAPGPSTVLTTPDATVYGTAPHGGVLLGIIGLLGGVANSAYTTGMAGAAWRTGTTTLADGTHAFKDDFVRVLLAVLLLAVIGIVLAIVTLGIGAVIFFFFAIYTIPAVVLANYGAWSGLKESCSVAAKRWVPTLIIVILLVVVALIFGIIATALVFVPFLGPLVAAIVDEIVVAFATLVVVGEYLNLRGASIPPPSAAV
jgi:hypothetical protein